MDVSATHERPARALLGACSVCSVLGLAPREGSHRYHALAERLFLSEP